jgi:low affinity Fe/Cu permease
MHLKLDELLIAVKQAHNEMVDIENMDDEELEKIAAIYKKKKEEYLLGDASKSAKDEIQEVASIAARKVAEDTARGTAEKVAKDTAQKETDKKIA